MAWVVKYCGGCNARYARTELIGQVAALLGTPPSFGTPNPGDVVVSVSGCHVRCAPRPEGVPVIQVDDAIPPEALAAQIQPLMHQTKDTSEEEH